MTETESSPSAAAHRDGRFSVGEGLPADWDDQIRDAPATLRTRWVDLAHQRIAGGLRTFGLYDADGALSVGFCGGVPAEPGEHPRFDPYLVLSGVSATSDPPLAPGGPHPWKDADPAALFPCCLVMFPNYETMPVGRAARDRGAADRFIEELTRWTRGNGVRSVVHLYLRSDYTEYLEALRSHGFILVPMVERCDMPVRWTEFEGYLATLSRNRRTSVRRERREIKERGIVITERGLTDDEPELLRLRCNLIAKYGGSPDPEREAFSLRYLHDHFGSDFLVIEARKEDRLLGFSTFIADESEWTVLMTGTDYEDPDASFTYFETMFYRPAELAPSIGIRNIGYGIGTIDAKRSRGCVTNTLYAAVRVNE